MSEQKFCVNCVHFRDRTEAFAREGSAWRYGCRRLPDITETDLVTGLVTIRHPEINAREERQRGSGFRELCGPDGQFWVQK